MNTAATARRVLLLMPTSTYHAADFVAAAARLGVAVTVGTEVEQALQDQLPESSLRIDFDDLDAATADILALHARFPIDAIVSADDETTTLAAVAAEALELPHNSIESVLATRNKVLLRTALRDAGLSSPAYATLDFDSGALEAAIDRRLAAAVPFPCVLKPTSLSASRGVIRADDADAFRIAARRIAAILEGIAGGRNTAKAKRTILVEAYVPGEEYAVEAMMSGGRFHPLAIFDKPDPLVGPYFEETIYVTPSSAEAGDRRRILGAVEAAAGALGLREGPLHAELRLNDEGAFVIDIAARAIGGLCARVLRFGTGVSLEELILRHALGEDFATFVREEVAAGVMMIPIPAAGVLRAVDGVEAARRVETIDEVTMTINPGQRLVPLPEGNRYLGFIFGRASSPDEVVAALREAHSLLEFRIDREDGDGPSG